MSANFTPELTGYSGIQPFRFWCQKVMPLTYDDSLSYYELLCKVVDYLNNAIFDLATAEDNIGALAGAYDQLQDYVNDKLEELEAYMNNYFDNLDVQEEINEKLDEMASSGALSTLLAPLIPSLVTAWLNENVTPVGSAVVVDSSLSVAGAAADAKVTGVNFKDNEILEREDGFKRLNVGSWTTGKYIKTDGTEQSNANGRVTDFIDVSSISPCELVFQVLKITDNTEYSIRVNYYDENQTFLSGGVYTQLFSTAVNNIVTLTTWLPAYVKYVRFSMVVSTLGEPIRIGYRSYPTDEMVVQKAFEMHGYNVRRFSHYGGTYGGLDNNGADYDNTHGRVRCNPIPVNSLLAVGGADNTLITYYAFTHDMTALGYWNGSDYSKSAITWTSTRQPIIIANIPRYEEVGYIKLYMKNLDYTDLDLSYIEDNLKIYEKANKSIDYEGKNWWVIGDSISYGTYSYGAGSISRKPTSAYTRKVAEMLGYDLHNVSVPNLGFTVDATDTTFDYLTLPDVLSHASFSGAELVTIALGTNDYGRNGTLGTLSDASTTNSVYGRFKLIIETLQTKCPDARIIVQTPIPRETVGNANSRFDMTVANASGFTFNALKEAIINACEYYGIEYINCTDYFALNYANYTVYQKDGLHPTIAGHELMAKALAPKLM